MPDSHRYPVNLYLINNVEDIVAFIDFYVFNFDYSYMFSCSRNVQVPFVEKPQLKLIIFQLIIYIDI